MADATNMARDDRSYWDAYYKKYRMPQEPSSFAEYVYAKYLSRKTTHCRLIELGCGNGRDSIFIAKNNRYIDVVGVDLAKHEIDFLNKCYSRRNMKFANIDFTRLEFKDSYEFIYSRFTFHAIDEEAEDRAIKWVSQALMPNGLFFLEVRSSKDKKLKKIFANHHYRRYIEFSTIKCKLLASNLSVVESIESRGLAKYKEEDPFIIRIAAKKV